MDSYEWNKIAGWVLAAAIAIMGLTIVTGYIYQPRQPAQPGFIVEGVEEEGGAAADDAEPPIAGFLQEASAQRGEAAFRRCAACHTINQGGANGIGPNLWGIMGARHAGVPGFGYSSAMAATADQIWDWDSMSEWLRAPRRYIPGNRMSFAGVARAQERADLLVFLNQNGARALPLPAPPPPPAAEEEAAEGAAPADDASALPEPPAGEQTPGTGFVGAPAALPGGGPAGDTARPN